MFSRIGIIVAFHFERLWKSHVDLCIYINIYSYRYAGETLRMKGGKNLSTKKNQNLCLIVKDNCLQHKDRTKCHNVTNSRLRFSSTSNIWLNGFFVVVGIFWPNSSDLIS